MAGASESSITSALEAQSKSMAAQSRLLQQIAERLDAQDRHSATLERQVTTNAHAIRVLEAKIGTADLTQIRADLARSLESQMDSHVAEFQAIAWERIDSVETTLSTRVAALEQSSSTYESWRPFIEHSVGFNHSTMEALRAEVSRIAARIDLPQAPVPPRASILGAYESTGGRPPVSALHIDGPWGHGVNHYCREGGQGFSNTHGPLPPNGMQPASDFVPFIQPAPHHDGLAGTLYQQPSHLLGQLPKVPFPTFDGDNPKLWQTRCEQYFTMYAVDPRVWIRVATMQFTGPAARWLQSVEPQLPYISWSDFGGMIQERFGRDQHEILIRQLFHIKQTTTVAVYVEQFYQLVDQLKAYSTISDPLYYTMRFIDGLRDDIKSVVLVQRPHTLDTAFVLAQLQEEVGTTRRDVRKFDNSLPSRSFSKTALPLPPPPRQSGNFKSEVEPAANVPKSQSTDDRLSTLYAYRKAKGLCYKCGLQYSRGHRCAETVSLQVVEELWQLINPSVVEADSSSEHAREL
jgi:hypothetical protein